MPNEFFNANDPHEQTAPDGHIIGGDASQPAVTPESAREPDTETVSPAILDGTTSPEPSYHDPLGHPEITPPPPFGEPRPDDALTQVARGQVAEAFGPGQQDQQPPASEQQ